jgi:N6-L-threonylcarbamoyladenine synthase
LIKTLLYASKTLRIKEIGIAGGVSANSYLRLRLQEESEKRNYNYYIPKFEYCTDNAAMIAKVGEKKYLNKEFSSLADTLYSRKK